MPKYTINHTVYMNDSDVEVPSVTTIIKLLNKPSITKWANYMGFKHIYVKDILEETSRFGTLIHYIINLIINDKKLDISLHHRDKFKVYSTLDKFLSWYKSHEVKPILTEEKLVTDTFGGTVDFYGIVDGKYTIVDFKTSKSIHLTMFIQLALYCILLEKKGYKIDQVMILSLGSEKYKTKLMTRKELEPYVKIGLLLVDLFHYYYDICKSGNWNDFNELLKG